MDEAAGRFCRTPPVDGLHKLQFTKGTGVPHLHPINRPCPSTHQMADQKLWPTCQPALDPDWEAVPLSSKAVTLCQACA